MVSDLATDATGVQLTLAAFLVGVAAGQLVFGPLSDRFGRKLPLVVGSLLFVASSAVVFAPTAGILTAARVVLALAVVMLVAVLTIVRESHPAERRRAVAAEQGSAPSPRAATSATRSPSPSRSGR